LSEPKFKLGDDGELEEIIEDFDEKPKRKRKPYNRTLYVPMSLMLILVASVIILVLITFFVTRPIYQGTQATYFLPTQQPSPTGTPDHSYWAQMPPCGMIPVTQKPRFALSMKPSGKDDELVRLDVDGTSGCRLTNNDYYDGEPAWSLDGKRIVFTSFFSSPGFASEVGLYIMDADGQNLFTLTKGYSHVGLPSWSPDGKQIVFDGSLEGGAPANHIFVINADGTNRIDLTHDALPLGTSGEGSADWSPDGKSIVFSSDRAYQTDASGKASTTDDTEIYVTDVNGNHIKRLTFNNQPDLGPTWSPDGQWIAFQREDNIFVMDKEGGSVRQLTTSNSPYTRGFYAPFWMLGSDEVGFMTREDIQFVNIHTGRTRTFPKPPGAGFMALWWPH